MNSRQEIPGSIQTSDGFSLGFRVQDSPESIRGLYLVHGLASNMTRWSELVENINLDRYWSIIRMDLRGHGTSMFRGTYNRLSWCKDLYQLIAHMDKSEVVLAGHSLGAQVVIEYVQRYSDVVQGLILIDPVFPSAMTGKLAKAKKLGLLIRVLTRCVRFVNALGIRRKRFPIRDLQVLDSKTRQSLQEHPELEIADLYMSPLKDLKYIPVANYLQDMSTLSEPLATNFVFRGPVLALLSAGGSVGDVQKIQQQLQQFPNCETVFIDADHWLLTEKPLQARQAIEQWCKVHFP